MNEMMDFPNTFEEFAEQYGFKDKKEIYTNGSMLIPVFRVKQWLEHLNVQSNDVACMFLDTWAYLFTHAVKHKDTYVVDIDEVNKIMQEKMDTLIRKSEDENGSD